MEDIRELFFFACLCLSGAVNFSNDFILDLFVYCLYMEAMASW